VEGHVRLEIAVGVDLDLVAGGRVETDLKRRRVGIDVEDENRAAAVRSRRKDVQVCEVSPRILGVEMIGHERSP
jgi:hypothetical protein